MRLFRQMRLNAPRSIVRLTNDIDQVRDSYYTVPSRAKHPRLPKHHRMFSAVAPPRPCMSVDADELCYPRAGACERPKLPDYARQGWLGTGSDICINVTAWMAVLIAWVIPVKLWAMRVCMPSLPNRFLDKAPKAPPTPVRYNLVKICVWTI